MKEKKQRNRKAKETKDRQGKIGGGAGRRLFAARVGMMVLGVLIAFVAIELFISAVLHYPVLGQGGLLRMVKMIYENEYRSIIQLEPAFARYDPELTYLLKSGTFRFRNTEFDVEYRVNSAGLRDEETALQKPEIIVLGDSEAMGWGVRQEETYAALIARQSKWKVLNAAISSYGTVREMGMLNRLDTTNLEYLIIHYMENDDLENRYFYRHQNTLRIIRQDQYDDVVNAFQKAKTYYPGKYLFLSAKYLWQHVAAEESPRPGNVPGFSEPQDKTEIFFLNAVMNASRIDLRKVRIIVLLSEEGSTFPARLEEEIRRGAYPAHIRGMKIVSMAPKLDRSCYYRLDHHMRAAGHERVAAALLEAFKP